MRNKIIAWLDIPRTLQEPFHALWNRTGELQGQINELHKEAVLEDINCPVCKRVTLSKKAPPSYIGDTLKYYCYGCGKKFEKVTDEKLVEYKTFANSYDSISSSIVMCDIPSGTVIKAKGGDSKLGKGKKCGKEPVKSGKK
jgi:hypothetical protein